MNYNINQSINQEIKKFYYLYNNQSINQSMNK